MSTNIVARALFNRANDPTPEPPPVENARWIRLTKGCFALVDSIWYDFLMQWNWSAIVIGKKKLVYAIRGITRSGKQSFIYMHRVVVDAKPRDIVDHSNHNTLDNRISNVRVADKTQSQQNRKPQSNNKSGFKGVFWVDRRLTPGSWVARIKANGVDIHLGFYPTAERAAVAYDCAARLLFKEFAWLNFPERETPSHVMKYVATRIQRRLSR